MNTPRPFNFDTVFDDVGVAHAPVRPRRNYLPDEVETIRAEAYRQGEVSAVALAQQAQAGALAEIAQAAQSGLTLLARVAHDHREACADLALACGRVIADAALERFPQAPLQAALVALAAEIETAPRLVIRAAGADAEVTARLEAIARDAGFPGQIIVKPEPGATRAAFVVEWGDGKAAFDPAAASERVKAAVLEALAAEGLHAEPLIPDGAA